MSLFDLFKRKKSFLHNWNFEDISDFEIIQNADSIQYFNKNSGKDIYFSVLKVNDPHGTLLIDTYTSKHTISEIANGWQLKGTKKFENQILVCVISVNKQDDIEWAKTFFDSIRKHQE